MEYNYTINGDGDNSIGPFPIRIPKKDISEGEV